MNDHYLDDTEAKILAYLRDKRQPPKPKGGASLFNFGTDSAANTTFSMNTASVPAATPDATTQATNKVLADLAMLGYIGLKADDLTRLNATDEYETESKVMAMIRAYWQVAYKVSLLQHRCHTGW